MAKMSEFLNIEREVVATIKSPQGNPIKVFGITTEISDKVIELNNHLVQGSQDEDDMVYYGGKEMLQYIFPLFTDLVFDLPEEELEKLAENPPFQLIQVQNVIKGLLAEINQTWAEVWQNQINQTASMMTQIETAKKAQESIAKVQEMMDSIDKKGNVKPAQAAKPLEVAKKPELNAIAKRINTETIVDSNDKGKTLLQNGMTINEVNDQIMASIATGEWGANK